MLVPLLLACEADLAIVAVGIGLGLSKLDSRFTLAAAAAISLACVAAAGALWALWVVAPSCVIDHCAAPPVSAGTPVYLAGAIAAQWTWVAAFAFGARWARNRKLRMFGPEAG